MNMMKFYNTFQIPTQLDSERVKMILSDLIDFNYKKKLGTKRIEKKYYGDYITQNQLQIWPKLLFTTGIGDKKLGPKIIIRLHDKSVSFKIVDNIASSILFTFFLILIGLIIAAIIHWIKPFESESFFISFILLGIIGIACLINVYVFNSIVKETKTEFKRLLKE